MARTERQEDGTRGGVGTLTKSGTRPRPRQAPEAGQAAPDPRRGRPVPPQPLATDQQAAGVQRPDASARTAGRRDQRVPSQRAAAQRQDSEQRSAGRRFGGRRADAPQAVAAPPRPGLRRRAGAPPQAPPAERGTGPQRLRTTGPQPAVAPAQPAQVPQAQAPAAAPGNAPVGSHRMPFVLLLCGLLGGALVSALVISTTLAEGSFQISKLQDSTSSLARQRQTLEEGVAQAESPQQIEQRASKLGMRRPGELQFLNLKTGKTTNDGPTWIGAVNAPGYAP
jgi:hypothetical protein